MSAVIYLKILHGFSGRGLGEKCVGICSLLCPFSPYFLPWIDSHGHGYKSGLGILGSAFIGLTLWEEIFFISIFNI